MNQTIIINTNGQKLYEFTNKVKDVLSHTNIQEGLCHLFLQHTSAGLIIQENADPSAKDDLENWLKRLVKDNDPLFTHTFEGVDDMPSHIKSVLTGNQLTIPIVNGKLALGTWQGIYLWEFRNAKQSRKIVISLM